MEVEQPMQVKPETSILSLLDNGLLASRVYIHNNSKPCSDHWCLSVSMHCGHAHLALSHTTVTSLEDKNGQTCFVVQYAVFVHALLLFLV